MSGVTVFKPKLARLKVKLTLSDEILRKSGNSRSYISISASYERNGFREQSSDRQRIDLIGSTQAGVNGATGYRGTALPNEPIILTVSVKEEGERKTVHEERLALAPGEERLREITIGEAKPDAADETATASAIDLAVDFLIKRQRTDGSWASGMSDGRCPEGATALIALALDGGGPNADKAIQAATQFLLKASPKTMKEVALQTLFLHRIGKPGAALLRRDLQWLVDAQITKGSNAGAWSFPQQGRILTGADGANSAYAILALTVAAPIDSEDEKKLGGRDWKSEVLQTVRNAQRADGSISLKGGTPLPAVSTAFGLEILRRTGTPHKIQSP